MTNQIPERYSLTNPATEQVITSGGQSATALFIGHMIAEKIDVTTAAEVTVQTGSVDSLARLPGSFSGVINQGESITAFADLGSQFPLYYTEQPVGTYVADSAAKLAEQTQAPLDIATLAAHICGMSPLTQSYTSFKGVRQIMGGQLLRIDSTGQQLETYENLLPKAGYGFEDAIAATRSSLVDAIQKRLNTRRLTADFSGGLDSTSLAFMAAALSEQDVPSLISYHPKYPAGDLTYGRTFAALNPRIKLHELQHGDDQLPYSQLSKAFDILSLDEPDHRMPIYQRDHSLDGAITRLGSTLHLGGNGGDALYDGVPHAADLLRLEQEDKALQQAQKLARTYLLDADAVTAEAYRHADKTLPEALSSLAEILQTRHYKSFDSGWLPRLDETVQWLTPTAREALAVRADELSQQDYDPTIGIGDYEAITAVWNGGRIERHRRLRQGHDVHVPFIDSNVIRAALGIPAVERNQIGSFKILLQKALGGVAANNGQVLVPQEVYRQRQSKGNYNSEMYAGIRQAMPDIKALFRGSQLAAHGVINEAAVQKTLRSFGLAKDFPLGGLGQLIATEIWLRQRVGHSDLASAATQASQATTAKSELNAFSVNKILGTTYGFTESIELARDAHTVVILNKVTGQLQYGNAIMAHIVEALNQTGDPSAVVAALSEAYPQAPHNQLRHDVATALNTLHKSGLLNRGAHSHRDILQLPPPTPVNDDTIGEYRRVRELSPDEQRPPTKQEKALAEVAFAKVLQLGSDFAATLETLATSKAASTREATFEEAHRLLVVAHQFAPSVGRMACFEWSLATVLMAAQKGLRVDWVMGIKLEPPQHHAWPEVRQTPVRTGADEVIEGVYTPWLRS